MWFDATAVEVLIKLRDQFKVSCFVETGSYLGVGTKFFAHYFERVLSCDINEEYLVTTKARCKDMPNVTIIKGSSPDVLRNLRNLGNAITGIPLFFLDAHWYSYWPILDELSSLKDFKNCIILIHDFKVDGFWHDTYQHDLDLPYVREKLREVNPEFHLYMNDKEKTHIWTKEEAKSVKGFDMEDADTIKLFDHAWVSEDRRYRGCLYAVPEKLEGYPLRRVDWNST